MVLTDKELKVQGMALIAPFDANNLSPIGYDLTVDDYSNEPGKTVKSINLAPGASVFVRSKEKIMLPNDMMATVSLRNSRIRQGLDLTAPVYQPGHETRVFFRVTNVSPQSITLDGSKGIATITFEKLDSEVERKYNGSFQNEFDFSGMSDYTTSLSKDISIIEEKADAIKELEKNIYGNVLAVMAVFVGIFSLLNVNVSLVAGNVTIKTLLTLNLATVGSIGFLVAIISTALQHEEKHRPFLIVIWIACVVAFIAAVAIQFFNF